MNDPLQALEDVRIEEEANCTIGAGYSWRALLNSSTDDSLLTQAQRQQLRILISGEFCQMLDNCDLGAGLSDAIRVGKQLLFKQLKQPSKSVQQQLRTALEAAMAADEANNGYRPALVLRYGVCSALLYQNRTGRILRLPPQPLFRHILDKRLLRLKRLRGLA